MENKEYVQQKIELVELIEILAKRKRFITIFILLITSLSIIYVLVKSPVYEAKALVQIGNYKTDNNETKLIDNSGEFSKKLSTIFIDLRKNEKEKESEIKTIIVSKGLENFIEITSEGKSNDLAIKEINSVVEYVKNEHFKILNDIKEKNYLETTNINNNIRNTEEQILNIDKKIDLYEKNIITLEEQMKFVIETLKSINSLDPSIAALKLMEKRDISNDIILNKSQLYDLIVKKEFLSNVEINKLIERKKTLESLILEHNLKNSGVVGQIQIDDEPIKPKKLLTVVVTFLGGFIFSIFIVFFMQFIASLKRGESIEK